MRRGSFKSVEEASKRFQITGGSLKLGIAWNRYTYHNGPCQYGPGHNTHKNDKICQMASVKTAQVTFCA